MPKRDLILLALEDDTILQLMQRALNAASYETAIASDRGALDKLILETVPALALIGEQFDNITGVMCARDILERFPTIPILIYAEKESTDLYREILQFGLSGCLYPPLQSDDIISAVTRSLQRARNLGDWLRREVMRTTASLERRASVSEAELKRYEYIFANIQDGVVIMDDDRRIQLINRAMEIAFDIPGSKLRGEVVSDVINHPEMHALLNRAGSLPIKFHEINFDDGRVYNAQFTPLGDFGSVITMQDISFLKQLDRMKNEFVNTVAHDLRSPLTSVLGYTELIARIGPLNKQQSEYLDRIRTSMENITSMVNELLDMSRLEAGFDTRRETIHLEDTFKYALDEIRNQLYLKNISLKTDIQKKLPEFRGNPVRISQLLNNLLENAIKYSPEASTIHASIKAEDSQIILSISDEGPGVPPSEQTRIFEKFYRASNVPEGIDGSGLGLAIVKSIVESHQGRIWVESMKGKGSTFFVVLPAYTPD